MLRRAFFKGVAAAVAGLFGGGWLLGRKKTAGPWCRCGLLADEHPDFWKSQVKPHTESTEDFQPVRRCPPNCPECRREQEVRAFEKLYRCPADCPVRSIMCRSYAPLPKGCRMGGIAEDS